MGAKSSRTATSVLPSVLMIEQNAPVMEGTPEQQLSFVVQMMREMSRITDPQELVRSYSAKMRQIYHVDHTISLSRRGLELPKYRITRSSRWTGAVNPWESPDQLPIYDRGLLGELLYRDEPTLIDELSVPSDDPAAELFAGMRSLMAIPLYENGEAINMVVVLREVSHGFSHQRMAMQIWMSNLFGRGTRTLVLSNELKKAYTAVEYELKAVADIQRSLLPAELPKIPGLDVAVHYQTWRHGGGDYYDFFKMPDDQWGILIADVSGHGTPAAVLMAITHSLAHVACDPPCPPGRLLETVNRQLARKYTNNGSFVTAFYGIYNARTRTLVWSNAGHPPPRLKRADGRVESLPLAQCLPLGIEPHEPFHETTTQLAAGESLLFYTDGISEARSPDGRMFDVERMDQAIGSDRSAEQIVRQIMSELNQFCADRPLADDRTLLLARCV